MMSEYFSSKSYRNNQEKYLLEQNKESLKSDVNKILHFIEFTRGIEENDSIAKDKILNYISGYRTNYGGYIFVNKVDGEALVFDGQLVSNQSIIGMTDNHGNDLYSMEVECYHKAGGGFMEYYFKKIESDKEYRKIAYVTGYYDFGWMVGAGNYVDELVNNNISFLQYFSNKFKKSVEIIFIAFLTIFILVYLLSRYISKRFDILFIELAEYFDKRIAGKKVNAFVSKTFNFTEVGEFVSKFDLVIDNKLALEEKQKNYAAELEKLVQERTQELERQTVELSRKNKELERVNDIFTDREFRIKELRDKIAYLTELLNKKDEKKE